MSWLPGGRGARFGRDANVSQRESYDERATRVPNIHGWIFCVTGSPYCVSSSAAVSADRLRLAPVPLFGAEYLLAEARLAVTVLDAGSVIRSAIYRYIDNTEGMAKVSGSDAIFYGDTTGTKKYTLSTEVGLNANGKYFIGVNSSSAVVEMLRFKASSTGSILGGVYYDCSASSLQPDRVTRTQMTAAPLLSIPMVSYLSYDAAEIM